MLQFDTIDFVELVELFWSLQVYRKKTLTKGHDFSRFLSLEKGRLKRKENTDEWKEHHEKENRRHLQINVLCQLVTRNVPKRPVRGLPLKKAKTQHFKLEWIQINCSKL